MDDDATIFYGIIHQQSESNMVFVALAVHLAVPIMIKMMMMMMRTTTTTMMVTMGSYGIILAANSIKSTS
jgi:saccharopine dehydrogenase-like NADP-dependent oxidoreductase